MIDKKMLSPSRRWVKTPAAAALQSDGVMRPTWPLVTGANSPTTTKGLP